MAGDVLFLGAGFSRGFGLPVMSEFFRHARNLAPLPETEKGWLDELQQRSRKATAMLEGEATNLEHVLSMTLMNYANVGQRLGSPGETEYARIRRILLAVFRELSEPAISKYAARLRWLFQFGSDKDEPPPSSLTIVTTNYDVAAEYCLFRLGARPRLAIPWSRIDAPRDSGSESLYASGTGPLLCKLHGSINWFSAESPSESVLVEDRVGSYTRLHEGFEFYPFPVICDSKKAYGNSPLIVPPMYFKHQPDPRLNANWIEASRALSSADRLAFIGYSFPASDTHMAYFLAAALNENVHLECINVVDPAAAAVCNRLNTSRFGSHFKQLLTPVPTAWETSHYGLR